MLKWLLIFTGVSALVVTVALAACKYERAREDKQRASTEFARPAAVAQPQSDNSTKQNCDCTPKTPCWYILLAWPEGMTVWVVILTFAVIGWQADETRKAAEAAVSNARAVINSERPWLRMVTHKSPRGGFAVRVKNKGRTPARIIAAHIGSAAVERIFDLPKKPLYQHENLLQDRIVVADDSVLLLWFDRKRLKEMMGEDFYRAIIQKRQAFVFGTVIYRNILNPKEIPPSETRWICLFELNEKGDSVLNIEGLGVAEDYDGYT